MAASGLAEEATRHIVVGVAGDEMGETTFKLNSDDIGFDLDDLQIGETRSIVDEQGRSVLITRGESGFSFNIDGKIIELPDFAAIEGEDFHWVTDGTDADVNVQVVRKHGNARIADTGSTVIVSPEPIDQATRTSIQSVLESAGYDSDVEFIDHEGSHDRQVFIKKVEKVVEAD